MEPAGLAAAMSKHVSYQNLPEYHRQYYLAGVLQAGNGVALLLLESTVLT